MRAQATLKNVTNEQCKQVIIRNLARILDMRVVDFNEEASLLTFLCADRKALAKVKKELQRLGYPVQQLSTSGSVTKQEIHLTY